ncbi:hypothetical protein JB92DRAFT_2825747 [Gautieria morchelliformis]|nr:hypothetical protein JB92DRAFT_2825747 [Gautieria morchelliformis]
MTSWSPAKDSERLGNEDRETGGWRPVQQGCTDTFESDPPRDIIRLQRHIKLGNHSTQLAWDIHSTCRYNARTSGAEESINPGVFTDPATQLKVVNNPPLATEESCYCLTTAGNRERIYYIGECIIDRCWTPFGLRHSGGLSGVEILSAGLYASCNETKLSRPDDDPEGCLQRTDRRAIIRLPDICESIELSAAWSSEFGPQAQRWTVGGLKFCSEHRIIRKLR